ncbi:N-alpha-acetyltransferase 20 [Gossypium australe]|uniref:N-alpha-acetyltransferase 20 n=1 Tax=Gossypium australe TaxID=47621 RepID=A0A5B6W105_9ROSI|nr:N-alpha-acetyltransferase 20 [Gossypium australe]
MVSINGNCVLITVYYVIRHDLFSSMAPLCWGHVQVMGKVEGEGESRHGRVTTVTVGPEYCRQKLLRN